MDTYTVVYINGFDPVRELWETTETTSGRCIVSFQSTETTKENIQEIIITFTRSESQLNDKLVSCIEASDGMRLITNSDILKICLAICPLADRNGAVLKARWRDSTKRQSERQTIRESSDKALYKRLDAYKYPDVGTHRRSVFVCSTWCEESIKYGLFTWLVRTLFA